MTLSKRLRFEILRRDNHQCRYCGAKAPDVPLRVDHVVPVALGGSDDPTNLVAACEPCNSGKSSVPAGAPLVDDVAADALRWARAMEEAARRERHRRSDDDQFSAAFAVQIGDIIRADPNETIYCTPDLNSSAVGGAAGFKRTVLQFRDNGLDLSDLDQAIRKASVNRAISDQHNWKYFCGIAWGMIRDRQEAARQILDTEMTEVGL